MGEMKFEISVVIPTYNRANLVCDAIDSVLKQTDLTAIKEIIVVDDGSSDNTREMIETKYRSNPLIKYIYKSNGGVSTARNVGMENSKGNWIALLDSDDEWEPHKIERQVEVIRENPDIDFLGSNCNGGELYIGFKHITQLHKASIQDLCIKFFPVSPSMLFKKEVYLETNGFNENQKYAEDGEFCLRVCSKFNYYHLPESLVQIGHGKKSFGESGLSGNLKGMYLGNVSNLKMLKRNHLISSSFYYFLRLFYWLKYLRRIVITKMRAKNK